MSNYSYENFQWFASPPKRNLEEGEDLFWSKNSWLYNADQLVKSCSSCGLAFGSNFHSDVSHEDGLRSVCKNCRNQGSLARE